jgi:hypothetical protein
MGSDYNMDRDCCQHHLEGIFSHVAPREVEGVPWVYQNVSGEVIGLVSTLSPPQAHSHDSEHYGRCCFC